MRRMPIASFLCPFLSFESVRCVFHFHSVILISFLSVRGVLFVLTLLLWRGEAFGVVCDCQVIAYFYCLQILNVGFVP